MLALALALASAVMPPLLLIALPLAIMTLIGNRSGSRARRLAVLALCFEGVIIVVLSGFALRGYSRFQGRLKQAECRVGLEALWAAQRSLFAREHRYTTVMAELPYAPPSGRYTFWVDDTRVPGVPEGARPGLIGKCPDCGTTITCVGQLDSDETLDLWSLSSRPRNAADGRLLPSGVPFNHVDDVAD